MVWYCPVDNYISVVTNALIKSLDIKSYYQRKLLKEGVERIGKRKKLYNTDIDGMLRRNDCRKKKVQTR